MSHTNTCATLSGHTGTMSDLGKKTFAIRLLLKKIKVVYLEHTKRETL